MNSMTSTTDSTSTARPSWQTEPCPDWCVWQPHSESEQPADRHHTSATMRRDLPLEKPAEVAQGQYEPEYVAVYLWQHVREVEPTITMCKGESREGFRLTLEDAEVLAGLLTSLVEEARRG